jgi:hypothetical protein
LGVKLSYKDTPLSKTISHIFGEKSPIKERIRLVFPLPLDPIINTNSQGLISREIFSSTFLFPKARVKL